MSQRKKQDDRCSSCLMRQELCICAQIPKIDLKTRLIVLIYKRELKTPTNTGRLAAQALTNSVLVSCGEIHQPVDLLSTLQKDLPTIVLYPSEDAAVLDESYAATLAGPVNLIVPDGNWRQTSKMRRRIPHMMDFPVVKVPNIAPSRYRVRKESKGEGLATIEAIARALGALEGPHVQNALENLLDTMVSRTLQSRGISNS